MKRKQVYMVLLISLMLLFLDTVCLAIDIFDVQQPKSNEVMLSIVKIVTASPGALKSLMVDIDNEPIKFYFDEKGIAIIPNVRHNPKHVNSGLHIIKGAIESSNRNIQESANKALIFGTWQTIKDSVGKTYHQWACVVSGGTIRTTSLTDDDYDWILSKYNLGAWREGVEIMRQNAIMKQKENNEKKY